MKQNITKEQWDELSDKEKAKINTTLDDSCDTYGVSEGHYVPTIGQMIEFLGDDLCCMKYGGTDTQWIICGDWIDFMDKELCDGLFTAVKLKLNDKN